MRKFLEFGKISVERLSYWLFWIGTVCIFAAACANGYAVYQANTYQRMVQQGEWHTSMEVNNGPLAVIVGIAYFVVGVLLWRLVCEIIHIVLNYFKSNTKESD